MHFWVNNFVPLRLHEASVTSALTWLIYLDARNWNLALLSTLRSWSFHNIPSLQGIPWPHRINEAMQKHHGWLFALDHGECSHTIWWRWRSYGNPHGYPASSWDTSSEISHLIHLEVRLSSNFKGATLCMSPQSSLSPGQQHLRHAKWLDQGQEHATQIRIPEDLGERCQCSPGQGCVEWARFESFHILFANTALRVLRIFFRGNCTRSISMPVALHCWLGHRDFTLRRGYDHKGSRVRGRRVVPYFSNLRGTNGKIWIGTASLSAGGLYSSKDKRKEKSKEKDLPWSRHGNWTFQKLLSKGELTRQPNCARNVLAMVLATSSVISGMWRRINSVRCSKVSFQVLNATKRRRSS